MALVHNFICAGPRGLLCAALGLFYGLTSAALATTTLNVQLGSTNVDKGQPVTGTVAISTTNPTGQFDLTVELYDNEGRVVDREERRDDVVEDADHRVPAVLLLHRVFAELR